jgi:hypothetical protein
VVVPLFEPAKREHEWEFGVLSAVLELARGTEAKKKLLPTKPPILEVHLARGLSPALRVPVMCVGQACMLRALSEAWSLVSSPYSLSWPLEVGVGSSVGRCGSSGRLHSPSFVV